MSKPIVSHPSSVRQSIGDLRDMANGLHYGELDPRWQVEKMARMLSAALDELDARLTKLEQYQQTIEFAEMGLEAREEARLEEAMVKGGEIETFKPLLEAARQAHQIMRAVADSYTGPTRMLFGLEAAMTELDEAMEREASNG